MNFRDAAPADAAMLAELGARTFSDTFGHLYEKVDLDAFLATHNEAARAAEIADPAYAIHLADHDGETIGFAKLGPPGLPYMPRDGTDIELKSLYLLKDHHGFGIADELMAWVVAEATRRGATQMYLSVFTENHRARRFYARHGFEDVGPYAFMVGTQADEDIVMRKVLE